MKKIAVLNDLSGLGKCSLTAAIPVISVMGIQACPLPTAVLSCQTGFPSYFCDDYTDRIEVVKINVDEEVRLMQQEKVDVIPTLKLFIDGKETARLTAPGSKAQIDAFIASGLGSR